MVSPTRQTSTSPPLSPAQVNALGQQVGTLVEDLAKQGAQRQRAEDRAREEQIGAELAAQTNARREQLIAEQQKYVLTTGTAALEKPASHQFSDEDYLPPAEPTSNTEKVPSMIVFPGKGQPAVLHYNSDEPAPSMLVFPSPTAAPTPSAAFEPSPETAGLAQAAETAQSRAAGETDSDVRRVTRPEEDETLFSSSESDAQRLRRQVADGLAPVNAGIYEVTGFDPGDIAGDVSPEKNLDNSVKRLGTRIYGSSLCVLCFPQKLKNGLLDAYDAYQKAFESEVRKATGPNQ